LSTDKGNKWMETLLRMTNDRVPVTLRSVHHTSNTIHTQESDEGSRAVHIG